MCDHKLSTLIYSPTPNPHTDKNYYALCVQLVQYDERTFTKFNDVATQIIFLSDQ